MTTATHHRGDAPALSGRRPRATGMPEATALARRLGRALNAPDRFTAELAAGLARLGDPAYRDRQRHVAPGIGNVIGVRMPVLSATARAVLRTATGVSPAVLLDVVERLLRHEVLEVRWVAFRMLERTVLAEPERSWQLLRRAAAGASDWITVDLLARSVGRGIVAEWFRWAEVEQLVYSASRWERRLVGSTIATMPFIDRRVARSPEYVARALPVLGELVGDADADVQKALAWAYRSVAMVDPGAVAAALAVEGRQAAATRDGHRAWIIRSVAPRLSAADGRALRDLVSGVRRGSGAPSTSRAADLAARFGGFMGAGAA